MKYKMDIGSITEKLIKKGDITENESEFIFLSCLSFINGKDCLRIPLSLWFEEVNKRLPKKGNYIHSIPLRFDFSKLQLTSNPLFKLKEIDGIYEITGNKGTINKIVDKKYASENAFFSKEIATVYFDRAGLFEKVCKRPNFKEVKRNAALLKPALQRVQRKEENVEDLISMAIIKYMNQRDISFLFISTPRSTKLYVHGDVEIAEKIFELSKEEIKRTLLQNSIAKIPIGDYTNDNSSLYVNKGKIYLYEDNVLYVFMKEGIAKAVISAIEEAHLDEPIR